MGFTLRFTDKELSIIEIALEEYLESRNSDPRFSFLYDDVAELSERITERMAW